MALVLPNTSLGTGVISPTPIEQNFTEIANRFGNIDNSDIKSGAGISVDKLDAQYEYLALTGTLGVGAFDATGNKVESCVSIPNDGNGDWTLVEASWVVTTDAGAGTGAFTVLWGAFVSGAWSTKSTPIGAVTMGAHADGAPYQKGTGAVGATLAFSTVTADVGTLMVNVTVADATSLDTGAMLITYLLKRKITA